MAWRYEFYFLVMKTILLSSLEDKIHIFTPCVISSIYKIESFVSATNNIDKYLTCDYSWSHMCQLSWNTLLLLYFCGTIGLFYYTINRTIHAWKYSMMFISGVEQDISLVCFAHLWDTCMLVNTQNKFNNFIIH